MQPASACLACQPVALQALVQSEPALTALWQALPRRSFGPGAVLQRLGDASDRCWLLESGLVRFYYLSEQGVERNRSFHTQGSWVGGSMPPHPLSSPCTIEALEATRAVELTYPTLQHWHRQFPQVQPLLDDAMGYLFTQQARREAELLTLSPEERYQAFLGMDGGLAKRIPIHHVASYLGISHVSLSRIRARLGMVQARRS
jgi:CRP-like cAMP-binding protein